MRHAAGDRRRRATRGERQAEERATRDAALSHDARRVSGPAAPAAARAAPRLSHDARRMSDPYDYAEAAARGDSREDAGDGYRPV